MNDIHIIAGYGNWEKKLLYFAKKINCLKKSSFLQENNNFNIFLN